VITLVVGVDGHYTDKNAAELKRMLQERLPNTEILIIGNCTRLAVIDDRG
jgi:hypothetical protein